MLCSGGAGADAAGDALVFHSHLMHKSTDNASKGRRAAMVYHFADAATIDRTENGLESRLRTSTGCRCCARVGRCSAESLF